MLRIGYGVVQGMTNCMSYCETPTKATHKDPKWPPLDEGKCLCKDCFIAHIDEALEELNEQIDDLQKMRDEACR